MIPLLVFLPFLLYSGGPWTTVVVTCTEMHGYPGLATYKDVVATSPGAYPYVLSHVFDLHSASQVWCALRQRQSDLLKCHIVDPAPVGPHRLTLGEFGCEIQPIERVAHGAHLVAEVADGVFGHAAIKRLICPQLIQVLCNCIGVADIH